MIHHISTHDKYELSDTSQTQSLTVCWYFIGGNVLCLDNDGLFPAQRKITTIKKMCTDLLFHTGQENVFRMQTSSHTCPFNPPAHYN